MLVYHTNPVGVELFSYVRTFFCSNKFAVENALQTGRIRNLENGAFRKRCGYDNHVISLSKLNSSYSNQQKRNSLALLEHSNSS